MQPKVKVGLLVGTIGLILNLCVASAMGICGPFVSLIAGALAGFFAARQENSTSKAEGARAGAIAGIIAGVLILIGQILATVSMLALVQYTGLKSAIGTIPSPSSDVGQQVIYYIAGLGTGICFGLVGVVLSTLAGAGTGYAGVPNSTNNQG